MGLIQYEQLEDDWDASANLWNSRFAVVYNEINGNLDASNLKNGAITTPKVATGAVTSDKLGFEKYVDDNGWLITDLGLVKLATKRRTFKVPKRNLNAGGYVTMDTEMDNSPVGFNSGAAFNVMFFPYMTGVTANVADWSLTVKEEDGTGVLQPNSRGVATRIKGGTSTAGEPGAIETWVIF